jgi:hypothetical protein
MNGAPRGLRRLLRNSSNRKNLRNDASVICTHAVGFRKPLPATGFGVRLV